MRKRAVLFTPASCGSPGETRPNQWQECRQKAGGEPNGDIPGLELLLEAWNGSGHVASGAMGWTSKTPHKQRHQHRHDCTEQLSVRAQGQEILC